jgi:hypothetical protein
VKIVAHLEHDQLTRSGLMVGDHHPADPQRQNHRRDLRGVHLRAGPQDDRVAIEADTASGTLGAWVDPHATGS